MLCLPLFLLCSSFNSVLLLFILVSPVPSPTSCFLYACLPVLSLHQPYTPLPVFTLPIQMSHTPPDFSLDRLMSLHASLYHRSFAWFSFICLPASCCSFKELPSCLHAIFLFQNGVICLHRSSSSAVNRCCNGLHVPYIYENRTIVVTKDRSVNL
jgi:hypothetical protein